MTPRIYYEEPGITLYHGDCREILPRLPKVDLVLTDPPYGVGFAEWDMALVPPDSWLPTCRSLAVTVLVTPGNANQADYPKPEWTAAWFRPGSVQRARGGGFSHWEPILIYGDNFLPFDAKQIVARGEPINGHPCPKPMSLWMWLLHFGDGSVLDPFAGSGTTLVAAKQLGRCAIGIEIEEKYCAIAARRIRETTPPLPNFHADEATGKDVTTLWDEKGEPNLTKLGENP